MLRDLPKGLISAVAEINNKSRQAYYEEQKALQEKLASKQIKMPGVAAPKADPAAVKSAKKMAEEAEGSTPKGEREKKLAAMKPPKNKITHGDVLKARGVVEGAEQEGTPTDEKKQQKKSPFDWKNTPRETREPGELTGHKAKKTSTGTVYTKENKDTPGNSTHQCAIHVKSEQFGEGRTLTSQHAEPDAEGNIAWYDVMFAEGIKRVNTKDIEIVISENHMNHKKMKKM